MRLKKYIAGILFFIASASAAQTPADYGFYHIPDAPFKHIYNLLIDRKGFIWIGNELGIYRYDGKSFTSFYSEKQSSLAMSSLKEDSYGRIWCRNFNDQVFYIEDEKMKLLQGYDKNLNISWFVIAGNELVAKCSKGLFIHNLTTHENKIISVTDQNVPLKDILQRIQAYQSNVFFLLKTQDGLCIYKYKNNHFSVLKPVLKNEYNSIVAVNKQYLVLRNASNNGITCFKYDTDSLEKKAVYRLKSKSSYFLSSVINGKIWIHSPGQSFLINDTPTINNLSLTSLLQDREGNMWASSLTYGLLLKKRPADWQLLPINKETGYHNELLFWNNQIISGTSKGMLIVSDAEGFLKKENKSITDLNLKAVTIMFVGGEYLYVYGAPYLIKLDRHFNIIKRVRLPGYMHDAINLANRMLVFNLYAGLVAIPENLKLTKSTPDDLPDIVSSHFRYDRINHFYRSVQRTERSRGLCYDSSRNLLYAGFSTGLYVYSARSVKEIRFRGHPIHTYSLIYSNNTLYISTLHNGILIWKNGQIVQQLNLPHEQLSRESIISIKLFGTHLWILTTNNIYVYDIRHNHFIETTTLPPLKGIQILDLLELNGYVYLSTEEGIYKVPLKNSKKDIPPLNYLLSVVVNGEDTIQDGTSLPYNKNSLQFNLTGLYYFNPEGIYFKYRLLGNRMDTVWKHNPPGLWEISFPNMMPDDYTFEAIAYTANGIPAKKKITFSFTIHKVWWQQWWFILSMVIMITILVYVFISMRLKSKKEANRLIIEQLKHESERLKFENAANESELKALKSQMNPHFISNSLNDIQELIMLGDKHAANEQLSNFATLSRLILSVSGKKFIPLATELYILTNYLALEGMRLRGNFSYDVIMEEEMDEWAIQIPPMIIQPFVENSVKHGLLNKKEGAKKLTITFRLDPGNQLLLCTITDNGIGRAKAAEMKDTMSPLGYDSFSIKAIRKRLDLMGQSVNRRFRIEYTDMKDEEGVAAGTSVTIDIPIYTA